MSTSAFDGLSNRQKFSQKFLGKRRYVGGKSLKGEASDFDLLAQQRSNFESW